MISCMRESANVRNIGVLSSGLRDSSIVSRNLETRKLVGFPGERTHSMEIDFKTFSILAYTESRLRVRRERSIEREDICKSKKLKSNICRNRERGRSGE